MCFCLYQTFPTNCKKVGLSVTTLCKGTLTFIAKPVLDQNKVPSSVSVATIGCHRSILIGSLGWIYHSHITLQVAGVNCFVSLSCQILSNKTSLLVCMSQSHRLWSRLCLSFLMGSFGITL